jgi:CheY-like chemotaxis protein
MATAPVRRRVLLVDDDEIVRTASHLLLERLGCEVTAAGDAAEALKILGRPGEYDLVITDQSMPGRSGVELLGVIHALRPRLPVVLASGYVDDRTTESALAAGADAVILKPFGVAELRRILDRAAGEG